MTKFQVDYGDGKGWQDVADEARMRHILTDHYRNPHFAIKEMRAGREVRTTLFACYRANPDVPLKEAV